MGYMRPEPSINETCPPPVTNILHFLSHHHLNHCLLPTLFDNYGQERRPEEEVEGKKNGEGAIAPVHQTPSAAYLQRMTGAPRGDVRVVEHAVRPDVGVARREARVFRGDDEERRIPGRGTRRET